MSKTSSYGLHKTLRSFSLTNIVIANMIGAGIFTTTGLVMGQIYNPLLMIGLWICGGILALFGALSYSELGVNMPQAGGEYVFLSKLYTPLLGFLSGWMSFIVGFSAPIAASSLAFSEYFLRSISLHFNPETLIIYKKGIAIIIIAVFTIVHTLGLKSGSKVQNFLTLLKISLIIGLILAGFSMGKGTMNHFHVEKSMESFQFGNLKTIALTLMWISFAFSGWNASTYVGSEIVNPNKNIPRSLILGTLFVTLIYVALNILYVYAIDIKEMKNVISIGGMAANNLFNRSLDRFFSLFISMILLSSISAFIIIGPRIYFAMSRSGHFFPFAQKINKSDVPGLSIISQSVLAIIFVISGTFDQILTFLGFSLGIFPIIAVAGVFKIRKKSNNSYKSPGYPYVQIIFITISLLILIFAYMEKPVESTIAIAVILSGIPVYYIIKKYLKNIK